MVEKLINNKDTKTKDKVLYDFIVQHNAVELVEKHNAFNRGDFFEMAVTHTPVVRTGRHEISEGDYTYKGLLVEIKYLTSKTPVDKQRLGTLASHYLIGFNNGKEIIIKLIDKKDIVIDEKGKIKYASNLEKGVRVEL